MNLLTGSVLVLLVVGSAVYLTTEATSLKELRARKVDAIDNLQNIKEALAGRKAQLVEFSQDGVLVDKMNEARREIEAIQTRYKVLYKEIEAELPRAQAILEERRKEATGTAFAELKLPDGRVLKDVKIVRVDEKGVSVANQDSVIKLAPDATPENWRRFFRFDVAMAAPAVAVVDPEKARQIAAQQQIKLKSDRERAFNEHRQKVEALQKRIDDYGKLIDQLMIAKGGPLSGLDRGLKPGTKIYELKMKQREAQLNQQAAAARQAQQALRVELQQLQAKAPPPIIQ